jgi:hypothetical protein
MRYINFIDLKTPEPGSKYHSDYLKFVTKSETLLAELKAASNAEERKKIIDDNSKVWGILREWLLSLSHQKCWFSEAKDCFSHWDVEHFRPKKSVKDLDGTEHDGYWWLAFELKNFRICGNAGNRKKGTYFPLRDGCTRVIDPNGDLRYEDPLLLDPTDSDDPILLSFNVEGRAIPSSHIDDEWEKLRVTYSIERYNLDFPPLMNKRKLIWQNCWQNIQAYLDELKKYHKDKNNSIAKDRFREKAKNIRDMLEADQELSSVACACLLSTGDDRLRCFLRSR